MAIPLSYKLYLDPLVQRTLAALVKEGYIVKIGAGRLTAYGKCSIGMY